MDNHDRGTTILVGTDFSTAANRALDEAVRLAQKLSARIDLAHVFQPAMFTQDGEVGKLLRAGNRLEALRGLVPAQFQARMHLASGDPVSGLLGLIYDLRPALLVVGSLHRSQVLRHLLGSVTGRLCHQSPVSVLVVPAPALAAPLAGDLDLLPMLPSIARSCARCGHIHGEMESAKICSRCGSQPAAWDAAFMSAEAVDAGEDAVGEGVFAGAAGSAASDTMELFQTSPPGTSGYDVNPELRVRYR